MRNTISKKFIGKSRILYIGVLALLFAFLLPIRGTAATEALALSVDSFGPTNTSGVDGSTLLRTTGSAFTTGNMIVVLGTSTNRSDGGNKTLTRNVGTALVGQNVYVGFSAATGGARENHDVLKWYFKNSYVAGGLSSTAGTYVQSAATAGITLDSLYAPTAATIQLFDAAGTAMAGTGDVYVDDALVASDLSIPASGYTYSFVALNRGDHTLRAVATGGSSALKAFTLNANAPSIGTAPQAKSVMAGSTATFTTSTTSSDGGAITYQWQVYGGSS